VQVVFHVIISDLWEDMNPEKYNIFVRCQHPSLGGWEGELRNKMTFDRYLCLCCNSLSIVSYSVKVTLPLCF
jgi:hypothetical protein